MRLLTGDDEEKARRSFDLFRRVEQGLDRITTSPLVIFEVVSTLGHSYGVSRGQIRDLLLPFLTMRNFEVSDKRVFQEALLRFAQSRLSFADAYNWAYMRKLGLTEIYSYDTDFDETPGIHRLEP